MTSNTILSDHHLNDFLSTGLLFVVYEIGFNKNRHNFLLRAWILENSMVLQKGLNYL